MPSTPLPYLVLATSLLCLLPNSTSASPFYSHMILNGADSTYGGGGHQAALRVPPSALATAAAAAEERGVHRAVSLVPDDQMREVAFEACGSGSGKEGVVRGVRMGPCVGNGPCEVRQGENYTIAITFTPPRFLTDPVTSPRSNVFAHYAAPHSDVIGPYPGQSFSACTYTSCPLSPDTSEDQVYTFPFIGFPQALDKMTFNITSSLSAPSIFCVGVPIALPTAAKAAPVRRRRAGKAGGPRRLPFGGIQPKAW